MQIFFMYYFNYFTSKKNKPKYFFFISKYGVFL